MKFIHLTDTHLLPPGATLCALDPAARLRKAIDRIAATDADADFAVLTGDLSYHGGEPAYRDLRGMLEALPMPCHLLIGNHDDRETFKRIFPETGVDENGFVQYAVETDAGVLIALDTVEDGSSRGRFCDRRLAWLRDQLARCRDEPVYLFMHHPPFRVGIASLDRSRVRDAEGLAHALEAHGGVRHVFYGHVHRPIAGSWRGVPATGLPGTNHQVGLYLGPEEDLVGTHEPPAYGVCLIDDESVVLHQRYFLDDSARFRLGDPAAKDAPSPAALPPVKPGIAGFV